MFAGGVGEGAVQAGIMLHAEVKYAARSIANKTAVVASFLPNSITLTKERAFPESCVSSV